MLMPAGEDNPITPCPGGLNRVPPRQQEESGSLRLSALTPPWGARRWPGVSPGSATATPSGGPRPDWPPQSVMSLSQSSRVCHGPNPQPGPLGRCGGEDDVRDPARPLYALVVAENPAGGAAWLEPAELWCHHCRTEPLGVHKQDAFSP